MYFTGGFRLVIDAIGRAEKGGLHAKITFQKQLGKIQFNLKLGLRKVDIEFRVRKGVIADLISQGVFALHDVGFLVC